MNETLAVIKSRRSIKEYKPQQIADSELQAILEVALLAPNARNQQPWHFTVIQNKQVLDRMVSIIKENIFKSDIDFLKERASAPNYNTFHHAPTVILISADETSQTAQIDCALAAENILLAAASLNIGSRIITSSRLLFESEEGNQLGKELGIPDGYTYICTISLGYKDGEAPATPPRNKDVINYVK